MTEPQVGFVQVRCTDMEDYARIHNEGYATAVEQFGELLADARQDLAPEAGAADLMAWLEDAVGAMTSDDPRPLLDRETLSLRLQTAQGHGWDHDATVDAVMELVRPMPAVPQLREVLHDQGAYCGDCNYEDWLSCGGCEAVLTRYAQVVLALLKGGQS